MSAVVQKKEQLYEGKAKKVFATTDPNLVIIDYKDSATAFNGRKKGEIDSKGALNNAIASQLFELLAAKGIPSHFVQKLSDREMLCKRVKILPLEVITRNVAAGSFSQRLGVPEGSALKTTVYELSYKDDALGDPLINDYHAVAVGAATWDDLETLYGMTKKINGILSAFFLERGVRLIDFKLEFGKDSSGAIILADEISPDTCRFWDAATGEKLDKDRFRRDLGNVKEAYVEIFNRMGAKT
ncbi:MAG: phosphoribosylaminoimidazolesuccinocarboxamide synthase [Spirochaetaceae bacterium]|jgi:phosphoribosylaminoimidazole-succinocarboxamide synthase|nr:phosphoribosylaminoimidazolesuccinocarboxamide synthase [Spirochaetaceae bacterium]